jgi:nitrite reductase/ring-hydroxylating ferredoxin subunit/uncharacterized membrane protein
MDLRARAEKLKEIEGFDRPSELLSKAVAQAFPAGPVKDFLSGTWLGHSLHPMLTDVPIGAWTSALVLDLVGGKKAEPAADLLVGTGIVATVPTAIAGLSDWSDTYGEDRRIGFAHLLFNELALAAYIASLTARRRGRRGLGKLLGLTGAGAVSVGAYLGGHLSLSRGIGVNQTAFEDGPSDWTFLCAEAELVEGQPKKIDLGQIAIFVLKDGDRLYGLSDRCSHLSGPLHEGEISDGCVTCPWHGSRFSLDDGSVVRGPATDPQPVYEMRVVDGRVEVRARESH